MTSFPRLTEARTRFIPSPLPICQIKASAAWFLKGQSLACSSYQTVLWRPSVQRELLDPSAQLTPGAPAANTRSPTRGSRILLQPSPPARLPPPGPGGSSRALEGLWPFHCAGKSEAAQALSRDPGITVNLRGPNAYGQRLFEEQQKWQTWCLVRMGASEIIRKEVVWGDHHRGKDIQEISG